MELEELAIKPPSNSFLDESYRSRGSSRSCSSRGGTTPRQYPRCNLYLTFCATQLVSLSSLASSSSGYNYSTTSLSSKSAVENAALALSSLSFALSFLIGVCYFHRPFREWMGAKSYPAAASSRCRVTLEQWLSLIIFIMTNIQSILVLHPSNELAVSESDIWNANLLYATWASLYGCAYLMVDSFFSSKHNGRSSGGQHTSIMKQWFMVLFSSIGTSIIIMIADIDVHESSTDCSSFFAAGLLNVCCAFLSLICGPYILFTKRSSVATSLPTSTNSGSNSNNSSASKTRRWIQFGTSSIILTLQCIAVALLSTNAGQHIVGNNAFLSSWISCIVSIGLWKACVDSLFFPQPERPERNKNKALSKLKLETRRRQRKMMNDSVTTGEGTHDVTSDEEEHGSDDGSIVVLYQETMHCIHSLSGDVEDGHRQQQQQEPQEQQQQLRTPLDSEEQDEKILARGNNTAANDAEGGYYSPYNQQAADKYSEEEKEKEADNDDCTGYYSGSAAVQIRTGMQEDVSILDGSARTRFHQDPSGRRASLDAGDSNISAHLHHGQSRSGQKDPSVKSSRPRRSNVQKSSRPRKSNVQRGPLLSSRSRRSCVQEDPSTTSRSRRKYEQESRRNYVQKEIPSVGKNNVSTLPPTTPFVESLESLEINLEQQRQTPTMSTPKPTPKIIPLRRRQSRDSMSNLSPLQEATDEDTSPGSTTKYSDSKSSSSGAIKSKSGSNHSSSLTTKSSSRKSRHSSSLTTKSSDVESVTPRKKNASVSSKNTKTRSRSQRGPVPPPPPRPLPQHRRTNTQGNNSKGSGSRSGNSKNKPTEKKLSDGSSGMRTVGPPVPTKKGTKKQVTTSSDAESVHSSDSDFEIVLNGDGHSVVTELTNEGFDLHYNNPDAHDVIAAAHAAAVGGTRTDNYKSEAIAAAKYHAAQTRLHQQRAVSYRGIPRRMPLYNGSNASGSTFSAGSKDSQVQQDETLFASVGNFDDIPYTDDEDFPLTEDEESALDRGVRQRRRKSGGVDSDGSSSSSDDDDHVRVGGTRNSNEQLDSNSDQRKMRSSTAKPCLKHSTMSNKHKHSSEADLLPQSATSPVTDLLETILGSSYNMFSSTRSPAAAAKRRSSLHSFFSEEDSQVYESYQDENFDC